MRTREEQIAELTGICEDAGILGKNKASEMAEDIIKEAEERVERLEKSPSDRSVRKWAMEFSVENFRAPEGWPEHFFNAKILTLWVMTGKHPPVGKDGEWSPEEAIKWIQEQLI